MLIPASAYAIDYRDSTGYTPSWAIDQGYHSVLLKCTEMIGDYSRDGNWCFEWTAYVLDQGVDGFTHYDAILKIELTTKELHYSDRYWIYDGIKAWTTWFKSKYHENLED